MSLSAGRLFDDLRRLRVVLIHPPGDDRAILEDQLLRIGCPVRVVWPFPSALPQNSDVIIFLIGPDLRNAGNWSVADTDATLVALSEYENPTALKMLLDTQAHGVIVKPYRSVGILSTLVLARANCGYQRRQQQKIGKLEEAIKGRRHLEKAIRFLMEAHGLNESAAYEHIRARATSLRITIGEIATMVIDAHETIEKLALGNPPTSTVRPDRGT